MVAWLHQVADYVFRNLVLLVSNTLILLLFNFWSFE
jgi:hypothetical protein